MFELLLFGALGFAVSFFILPIVSSKLKAAGFVGIDVHKKSRSAIPEMGGIVVLIGLMISTSAAVALTPRKADLLLSFICTALIAGVIGLIDDLKTLSAKLKPFLTLFAGLPILYLRTYDPHPTFPIIGQTRLTIVYPVLIPIAIAVCSNAVNMMDPFNGTMSGTCSIVTLVLLTSAFIMGRSDALIPSVCLLGPLLAFFYYNRYPSKVFSGDVGSLSIGAALGAIAIVGRLEAVALVAFMPQIMNAFYGLSSIGRLYERREVTRPVTVLEDGRLAANVDPKAPITLARFILARGPLHEYEAVRVFMVLSIISGALAVLTAYLNLVTP